MCAIDAIGIYYTLDESITIYSEDEFVFFYLDEIKEISKEHFQSH